jgi:hypothetical protein
VRITVVLKPAPGSLCSIQEFGSGFFIVAGKIIAGIHSCMYGNGDEEHHYHDPSDRWLG